MRHSAAMSVVDRVAASLDGVFQGSERVFATIGAGLGDAIIDFGALTSTFETLSSGLDNEDMREAADRLAKISSALDAVGDEMAGELAALAELLAINREVADLLGRLQDGARTMTILTLNAKIETTRLDREQEDLSIFSVEMARTVKIAQETVDAHGGEQATLIRKLASACLAQAEFERHYRGKIATIAQELKRAFDIVDERRRQAARAAGGIGARSKQISSAIGAAIIALQIGDNTRQRIEHVVEALRMSHAMSRTPGSDEAKATLKTVCLLESAQIDAASSGFDQGLRHIQEALEQLVDDCAAIGSEGAQIWGAENAESGSFLGTLIDKLETSKQLMRECATASAAVEEVKSEALQTLIALQERMHSLEQAVKQMMLVGINAGLKSRQFGSGGLALGVIAEQLRGNAQRISCDAEMLMPSLGRALALARGFEAKKTSVGMDDFSADLSATLGALDVIGRRLEGAFGSLLTGSRRVKEFLGGSIAELAPQQCICEATSRAARDLEQATRDLPETPQDDSTAALLEMLWGLYTMEGERAVHRAIAEPGANCQPTPRSGEAEEDVLGDILFA
ncbi:hypothetical protein [Methylosinus sp. Sm6]|uniref:hypothetical protein n=1 Tax=Methylosinus sp. Sm6 TaxID=2866948 RepID=UPI001C994101|nr:hypothetical protein [Methylosinus sp. Sm6]MBY6242651.1 hypothetical protein [Methylosinus sp. Sm6]